MRRSPPNPPGQTAAASGLACADAEKGESTALVDSSAECSKPWPVWQVLGPGLLVCLADTDAGCLIVAGQSGARWGYSLLPLQVLLIPILYMTQELTVRLGVHTRQGHVSCIWQQFGRGWAVFACTLLVCECILAMVSEMSGIAAVGELWGVGRTTAALGSAATIVLVVFMCNYRQIETLGVVLGLFELTFVVTMFCFHPSPMQVLQGANPFSSDPAFMKLVAANIGAVLMPWMIYFQQSAVVSRRVSGIEGLRKERVSTMVGSVLTQLIMIGTLVTLAAAHEQAKSLDRVRDIVDALSPVLGELRSRVMVTMAFIGGSLCAAFVVTLAAAWAMCDALGRDNSLSLDASPASAPWFYGSFLFIIGVGVLVLVRGVNIIEFNIMVMFVNGVLLPFTLACVYLLVTGEALPSGEGGRVEGRHKLLVGAVFAACGLVCVGSSIYGVLGTAPGGSGSDVLPAS